MYPLRRNGQLITELISEAGGKNQMASNRIILLPAPKLEYVAQPPQQGSMPTAAVDSGVGVEIDVEALLGRIDQRPLLVPLISGDTVVVPEAGNFEVDGEVQAPGSFKLTTGTSVIGAIAAAGGFTYSANVKQVEVIRDIGGGRKALATLDLEEVGLRGGKDIRLRAGDLVRVPSEPGRFFERQVVEALNSLFNGVSVNRRAN
jgi:protein involved in polysaccharide export with SLBB domain